MIGWSILAILTVIEIGMMGYSIFQKKNIKTERAAIRIGIFVVAVLAALTGIINWNFRVIALYFVLLLLAIYSAIVLVKHLRGVSSGKRYTTARTICHTLLILILIGVSVLPTLIFPQFKKLETTGQYDSQIAKYTWTDNDRMDTLSPKNEARNVTVDFYYPSQYKDGTELSAGETFPLIVFSHGAFGYIESNYTLFKELASHGYIVCSISHTYHAFFTKETNGSIKLVNSQFFQEAMDATNAKYGAEEQKKLEEKWMAVRTWDMNFVLDTTEQMVEEKCSDAAFKHMNINKIGLLGHSLGGATSVQIARERDNIGAVIVLDGAHLGEFLGYKNGKWLYNEEPIKVPILDMRDEDESISLKGTPYETLNDHTIGIASEGKAVTILGTKHMNFTDLPMFSPFLASKLGTGSCDPDACTKQIDSIVLQWFNYYIKGDSVLDIKDTYELK